MTRGKLAVIKTLKKTYILKGMGIPKYYLDGNVEFLGEAWNNRGFGLSLSANTNITKIIPELESLFVKEFKPINTPMSVEYYPEVDDSEVRFSKFVLLLHFSGYCFISFIKIPLMLRIQI
jgi:hypothetical protein